MAQERKSSAAPHPRRRTCAPTHYQRERSTAPHPRRRSLGLVLCALALCALDGRIARREAQAAALREAADAGIALRQAGSDEDRQAALARTFDAAGFRQDASPAAIGRFGSRRIRGRFSHEEELRDAPKAMPDPPAFTDPEGWDSRLAGALSAAFGPWRTLLDRACDSGWTGSTRLRSWWVQRGA